MAARKIRVQLADSGHPVIGDERYGSGRNDIGRLALHARAIELTLPGRDKLKIESPSPPEFEAAIKAAPPETKLGPEAETRRRGNDRYEEPRKRAAPSGRRAAASSSRSGGRSGARPRGDDPRGK